MKAYLLAFVSLVCTSSTGWAEEPKKEAAPEKIENAEAKPKQAVEAKQVIEVFEALGAVADVFAGAVAGEVVGIDPLEQQFLQQFRQLAKTELNFVRTVCQPNKEQDKKIKTASDVSLKAAVKKFAEIQKKLQNGIQAGQQPEWPDPRKLMSDVLLKSVKETLSAEQAKRYEIELEKRAAARKRAALMNFVAKLDKDLVLTAEQREKLAETLKSNWKDAWCQQLEVFMYGDTYMPVLPDAQVVPILTEKQKQIWNGMPKNQNMIWGWAGFGFVQGIDIGEDAGVVIEQAVEARPVEEKPDESKKADGKKDEKQ